MTVCVYIDVSYPLICLTKAVQIHDKCLIIQWLFSLKYMLGYFGKAWSLLEWQPGNLVVLLNYLSYSNWFKTVLLQIYIQHDINMKIHNLYTRIRTPTCVGFLSICLTSQLRTAPSLSDWPTVLRPLLGNLLSQAEPASNGLYSGEFD